MRGSRISLKSRLVITTTLLSLSILLGIGTNAGKPELFALAYGSSHGNSPKRTPTVTATPSRTPTATATATRTATSTPTATATPTATPTSGSVTITSPASGATVSGTVSITVQTTSPVNWVNFYVDGGWIASSPPSTTSWNSSSVSPGSHTISVKGYNTSNVMIATSVINVTVGGVASSPTPTASPSSSPTASATSAATPTPTPTPAAFLTLPPNAALPSDSSCATNVSNFDQTELAPINATDNLVMPTLADLNAINFYSTPTEAPASDMANVSGDFTGTTTQILRWASCKWGLDENAMKGEAWAESGWKQPAMGDWRTTTSDCQAYYWDGWGMFANLQTGSTSGCYQSYGILQIKVHDYDTWDMAHTSTPFNADFRSAEERACINGDFASYFSGPHNPVTSGYPTYAQAVAGQLAPGSPNTTDTMFWGCMGAWLSGSWYDTNGLSYINTVKQYQTSQPWPH